MSRTLNSQQFKTPLAASSFSLNNAPSKSLRGTIVSLFGDVGWQSRIATEPAQITKPMQIQQGEKIVVKEEGLAHVAFSRIVDIAIYPKTEIDFIQTLPSNILIEQNSGKSDYIKINNNSLSIRSLGLLIKIIQGEITVSVSENQPYITVDIKKGSITAGYNDLDYTTQTLSVSSHERLIFRTDTKRVTLLPLQ